MDKDETVTHFLSGPLWQATLQEEDVKDECVCKCYFLMSCMSDQCEVRMAEGEIGAGINLLLLKNTKRATSLMSTANGQITINSTHAFTLYALRKDLRFNKRIFVTETIY